MGPMQLTSRRRRIKDCEIGGRLFKGQTLWENNCFPWVPLNSTVVWLCLSIIESGKYGVTTFTERKETWASTDTTLIVFCCGFIWA